jgi:hypothetical protein
MRPLMRDLRRWQFNCRETPTTTTAQESAEHHAIVGDRAYAIWEEEGQSAGNPSELWQRAERMVAAKERAAAGTVLTPLRRAREVIVDER